MDYNKVSPLFNYIGGKSWLKNNLRKSVETVLYNKNNIDTYVEPFAGGLGAFLGVYDLLFKNGIKNIVLNDINGKLINFYKVVNESNNLIENYMKIENEYVETIPLEAKTLHKTKEKDSLKKLLENSESFYKEIRNKFNTNISNVESAACLLFLQNHCFNGVYRENSSGGYNTPFNWEAKIFDREKIEEKINSVKKVFKLFNVEFKVGSFADIEYNKNTLYYIDPPYINEDLVENKYNKSGFTVEMQKDLINRLNGNYFIYSNHDNNILLEEFENFKQELFIQKIARKNIIAASNESRKTDKIEILVFPLN